MRRFALLAMLAVAALSVWIALGVVSVANANNAAIVIYDNPSFCGFTDGAGNEAVAATDRAVITSNGAQVLICKATGIPNPTGAAVHWNYANTGVLCGMEVGQTAKWNETVSASGQVTLTCHL